MQHSIAFIKQHPWVAKLAVTAVLAFVVWKAIVFVASIHYENRYVELTNLGEKKVEQLVANRDKMFKTIKGIASVSDRAADKFESIYVKLMEGKFGNARGGALMSWVHEQNPNADFIKLYDQLNVAIQANRQEYFRFQSQALDIQNQIKNVVETWPGRVFNKDKAILEVPIIVSQDTKDVFEKGVDDFVDPF